MAQRSRRYHSKKSKDIADGRMIRLFELSDDAVRNGRTNRARRYVSLAERIGQKTRTPADRRHVCKNCSVPLIQGLNCRTRVENGKVKITCLECGTVKRIPYIGEKRYDGKRSEKGTDAQSA